MKLSALLLAVALAISTVAVVEVTPLRSEAEARCWGANGYCTRRLREQRRQRMEASRLAAEAAEAEFQAAPFACYTVRPAGARCSCEEGPYRTGRSRDERGRRNVCRIPAAR